MSVTTLTRPAQTSPRPAVSPSDRLTALLEHLPAHEVITAQVNQEQLLAVLDQLAPTGLPIRDRLAAALRNLAPAF